MIAYVRSLADPEALAELVHHSYDLPVRGVLIRSFANDVYELSTPQRRYVLKVYGAGPGALSLDEVVWEQELANHVAAAGVEVARVIPLADGRLAGELAAPEGPRGFALTEFVTGEKPQPPYDDRLYHEFGRLIARFHQAGDSFASTHHRRPIDLSLTLEEPLALVLPALAGRPADAQLVRALGAEARQRLDAFAALGLAWGLRHGDVTLDNLMCTDRGLVLYDFDCAGWGWRAADLAGVSATDHWEAFLAGYRQVRDLSGATWRRCRGWAWWSGSGT